MPDDIQLQVGLDLDALKTSAERGAGVLGQAFQNAMSSMLSGQTLGSGLPPQQMPGGYNEQMLEALDGIQQVLQAGFAALVAMGGGGGGGVGGPSSGGPKGPPTPAAVPGQPGAKPTNTTPAPGGGYLSESWNAALSMASRFPQQAFANMYESGYYRTDIANFAHQSLSSVPILNQFSGVVANTLADADSALRDSTGVFRKGGVKSWRTMHDFMLNKSGEDISEARRLGLDRGDLTRIMNDMAGYGESSRESLMGTMQLQGLYGLGSQGSDLAGVLRKGGATGVGGPLGEPHLFAEMLAMALATNLDRGRWGEAFTALTAAARRVTTGALDAGGMIATENFVNQMGGRFQGDTSAHQSMVGMLQGLQGGQGGGLAQIMALQAGGLGGEADYFTALDRMNVGAAMGGIGLAAVLERYKKLPFVQRYMQSGSEADLNRAYILLSRMLPQFKPTDIKEMLRQMRKSSPELPDVKLVKGFRKFMETGRLPGKEGALMGKSATSIEWSEAAIGDTQENTPDVIESMTEMSMTGALRTGPAVEMVDAPYEPIVGYGQEQYGASRDYWPMGRGDEQEKGMKPGWRRARPTDPKHMARDIVIGNGKPGQRVYAPKNGVWLTQTPVKANRMAPSEGYIGEMLSDDAVRYKFMHLEFDPTLTKGMRIAQGRYIGTVVAGSGADWKPHLHLEARKVIDGKTTVVDPNTTMGVTEREIMNGTDGYGGSQNVGGDAGPAPEFIDPSDPDRQKILPPDKVVPLSMNQPQRMEVIVRVFDSRVSVQRRSVKSGAPGQNFNKKVVG